MAKLIEKYDLAQSWFKQCSWLSEIGFLNITNRRELSRKGQCCLHLCEKSTSDSSSRSPGRACAGSKVHRGKTSSSSSSKAGVRVSAVCVGPRIPNSLALLDEALSESDSASLSSGSRRRRSIFFRFLKSCWVSWTQVLTTSLSCNLRPHLQASSFCQTYLKRNKFPKAWPDCIHWEYR